MRSHREGSGRDGQMSTMIRLPLDICPDRIRLNQTLVRAGAAACVHVAAMMLKTDNHNGTADDLSDKAEI